VANFCKLALIHTVNLFRFILTISQSMEECWDWSEPVRNEWSNRYQYHLVGILFPYLLIFSLLHAFLALQDRKLF
jgi:hypothetical protein